jgi:NADH:ubiquinone oxidoreductase subunit 5 (subunit L)/multisubunit Na+/H+ antiporter MnhA subunit
MSGEQDMNKMGGLAKKMPITCVTMWIATLAITAIPPFAGFFSKDLILSDAYTSGHSMVDALGYITAGLTGLYMRRCRWSAAGWDSPTVSCGAKLSPASSLQRWASSNRLSAPMN